jgi:Dolichyl-phosphate-mannose-protein mannosyltransferase
MIMLREGDPSRFGLTKLLSRRSWCLASAGVFLLALVATVPTAGDFGLTWDEPTYRYSQLVSAQWWEHLGRARSWADVNELLDRDSLNYYWLYGRFGPNLHPPLAGQACLLSHALFKHWVKDTPSRRLASVWEYSLTISILFGFLARRYGPWVGGVAAGALLFIPRVYGDGHIAGTDAPGLLLWAATAVAFWNALHAERRQRWQIMVGVLLGLAFVEKMSAVAVILPLVAWLAVVHLPRTFHDRAGLADWLDGVTTSVALLSPLVLASLEIVRLARLLPPPAQTDLFLHRPAAYWSGRILACPLAIWIVRRILSRVLRGNPVWGVERPALETWAAAIAFAPIVAWLGNPLWWREALPRLAHYLMLNTARRGVVPEIPIYYFGQTYFYTLPWHNAWVLMGITVPAGILTAALAGCVYALWNARRDLAPMYFAVHLVTLPAIRMVGTPAHDGVRLFLPTFFFLAAMAGWGTVWVADGLARLTPRRSLPWRWGLATLVLGPAAWQLVRIHPYELSYYNELIGGPRGAMRAGFELSYWYDAFNDRTITEINERLPRGATVDFLTTATCPETFTLLQDLGHLRGDLKLGLRDSITFPHVWLLTQDSKATAFTRLLFAMKPWYASRPRQLDGLRVASVADPVAVSRAWALELLLDAPWGGSPEPPVSPEWVRLHAPWLAWCWGDGVPKSKRLNIDKRALEWAHRDPEGLRSAARALAARPTVLDDNAARLLAIVKRRDLFDRPGQLGSERLLRGRPQALVEAVEILIARSRDVRTVLLRSPYTGEDVIGGFLDQSLP